MQTIFNQQTRESLVERIHSLSEDASPQWGKMNTYQMLKHCSMSEEMFHGVKSYKRLFIGRIFGPMVLKGILKNEEPLKRNQPTHPELKIKGSGNFIAEKSRWIKLLSDYNRYNTDELIHPFFGKMNKAQIGEYVYKHTDHHLRQFGV